MVAIVALRLHTHNGVGGSTIRNQTISRCFHTKMVYLIVRIREGLRVTWCRETRGNSRVTLTLPKERYGWNRAGWESTDRLPQANLRNPPARNRPTSPTRDSVPHVGYAKNCS